MNCAGQRMLGRSFRKLCVTADLRPCISVPLRVATPQKPHYLSSLPHHTARHATPQRMPVLVRSTTAAMSGDASEQSGTVATNPFIRVVLPTALALMLCNMDRICLSIAIIPMSAEFGWAASLQGVIQSAFLYGYMATQLIGGTLADKYGGKVVMAGGILWFSLASLLLPTAITPALMAAGLTLPAVLLSRCLVGLGEGVALPTMNNLVATHIPPSAKARALGMAFSGFHSGNLLGLILSPVLLAQFGWRGLFGIFGLLGVPLVLFWLKLVPSAPLNKPNTVSSSAAATSKSATSALDLLSKSATWAIIIVNIVNHWGYFIYLNWMPSYFNKALGFDLKSSSFLSFLPWLVMAVGSSASGWLADSLVAKGFSVTSVRKGLQSVAFLVPAVALMVLSQPNITPRAAVACMTVALGMTSLGQAGFVANMSDIAPKHAGKMFGLCNTFGSLSGIVGVTAVGFIVEKTKSFSPVFQLTAAMYVVGTIVWNVLCTGDKVFD